MSAIEQYLIDTYRASQHGAPMPPPPGRDDVATLRAVRTHAQAEAVLEGRPAGHPWLAALLRLLRHPGGPGGACATLRG
ncbi:hypothetical protein [Streptomyces antarcticus]|uniref:hypothetical protein n=1 Tax=Streptomyces antarcticus TaxID=2996458 RepID=UPI0022703D0A|nr:MULTISPECIES: hypothetical protein [unclassified Streptomyces]MCY0945056.1 hypothetical protein [Streptomyces sp. H34-AA3]MCY0952688.1 hypothetical protein [Streptomyces sp. H27-S2]MCZ4084124.1 hypothetical protein [Streptomyces sp. H34-S5]